MKGTTSMRVQMNLRVRIEDISRWRTAASAQKQTLTVFLTEAANRAAKAGLESMHPRRGRPRKAARKGPGPSPK